VERTAGVTATFLLAGVGLPEIVASSGGGLCVGCEAEMTSRSEGVEWRVSGRQEEFSRRDPRVLFREMRSVHGGVHRTRLD
jgi:hypothetical protein